MNHNSKMLLINHESILQSIEVINYQMLNVLSNLCQIPLQYFHNLFNGNQILLVNLTKYFLIVKYLFDSSVGPIKLA